MQDPVFRAKMKIVYGLLVAFALLFGYAACVKAGVGGPWV